MVDEIILKDLQEIESKSHALKKHFEDKSILVTGGTGFLGSWMCDVLLMMGAEISCVDNYSSGLAINVEHLLNKDGFKFINSDVRNVILNGEFDYIIHLASRASPEDYHLHQIDTLLTNAEGTKNMLELARKNDCTFLYSSTSEIYGDAQIIPTPEDYWGYVNSVGYRSCYDEGKRYGEALCTAYKREYNLDLRIVRIFNTFGPRIRSDGQYGRALSRFIFQALNDKDITIYGDGLQTRSFCYVTDTIRGILMHLTTKSDFDIINLGNDNEITIRDLAYKIIQKTNSKSRIIYQEQSPDDPRRRQPDISRASRIGWKPLVSFEEGLERTVEWIHKNMDIYR
ncbi:MAG: NAD-dependent epimerase/dehydratase family protein [Nitrososphaeraceae archaeon]